MKKIFAFVIAAMMIATFALSASAVNEESAGEGEILRGTPTIDGVIDDIYEGSFVFDSFDFANAEAQATVWNDVGADAHSVAYLLYDDNYLYIAIETTDNDIKTKGEEWVTTTYNPYENDCVELRLILDNTNFFKLGVDAYGYGCYTLQEEFFDITTTQYKTVIAEDNSSWVAEIAIPVNDTTANYLEAGQIGWNLWTFDYTADELIGHYNPSYDNANPNGCLFYALSDETAKAPAADTDTTDDTTGTTDDTTGTTDDTTGTTDDTTGTTDDTTGTDDTTDTTAPQTFDFIAATAVVALVSTLGCAVIKRK